MASRPNACRKPVTRRSVCSPAGTFDAVTRNLLVLSVVKEIYVRNALPMDHRWRLTLQGQDSSDIPLVEPVSAASKGDGRSQVVYLPIEDLPGIRSPLRACPDRSTTAHSQC